MGRLVPSFHVLFEEYMNELRRNYQPALREKALRDAFDSLLDEAWMPEQHAMMNTFLPTVVDHLNITANVDNRRKIMDLTKRVEALEAKVEALRAELQG
jgi:polyhydroxyalkanoate synthesis regulator phasin